MVLIMIRQKNIIANDIINEWKCNPNPNVAYDLCEKVNGRIHHLLFREIVFPVIKKGIKNNIEQDVIAAIKCIQNIYDNLGRFLSMVIRRLLSLQFAFEGCGCTECAESE
jgi:hypothetical protein